MKTVESELHYSLIKVLINTVIPQVNADHWILTVICINITMLFIKYLEYLSDLVIVNKYSNVYHD